jgi:NADPH-dependent glutamate synthase beta subunit-like oxidoreductase
LSIESINSELCNGCGQCVNTCPLDVIRLDTIAKDKNEYPACRVACPAGVDMRQYIYFLKEGMFEEAISILRESLPLPAVTGRVCPHPCEAECARKDVDESVNINALERFTADYWLDEKALPSRKLYAARIAVVGSGPAGLACAYFLNRQGYPVTVFEAANSLGGMLRYGIPEYRLPKAVLDAQINYIKDMGVEFKTGIALGKDISLDTLQQTYQAVFLAVGNQISRRIDLEGSQLPGVHWGLDFLREANLQGKATLKGRVIVIGGGNVAVDVALTALRSGAHSVQMACLEQGKSIPAFKEEIDQAIEEGVQIHEGWGPARILAQEGQASGIELKRCTRVFDEKGQFNPGYNTNEARILPAETIILAIGQTADLSIVPAGLKLTVYNTLQTDPITLETSLSGIFAGGDVVSGPASVVEAIAAGKQAAISIYRFIKGQDLKSGRDLKPKLVKNPPGERVISLARQFAPVLSQSERVGNFAELKAHFDEYIAQLEAQRCMTCGSKATIRYVEDCMLCDACELDCPQKAIYVSPVKNGRLAVSWG